MEPGVADRSGSQVSWMSEWVVKYPSALPPNFDALNVDDVSVLRALKDASKVSPVVDQASVRMSEGGADTPHGLGLIELSRKDGQQCITGHPQRASCARKRLFEQLKPHSSKDLRDLISPVIAMVAKPTLLDQIDDRI